MTAVSIQRLSRAFGNEWAVQELDLEIASGEMIALLGPSGCGKTTTLRMITGLLRPTSGDLLFDGMSVVDIPTERRGAALIFQEHLLFPTMTVAQNVGFGLKMAGVNKAKILSRVNEMLDRVELSGFGNRKAHELSGGQRQRVALARGLVTRPKVLLLDEPLANLDANLRITMRQLIRSIQRELGTTAIFVTHDQEEAVMLADRIVLMFDGKLQQVGQPDEFYRHPRTAGVAKFFRSQNFLSGQRRGNIVATGAGDLVVSDGVIDTGDGPVVITARPETLRLSSGLNEQNSLAATVITSIYMGTHTQLIVQLEDATWHVQAPPSTTVKEGDQIFVELPTSEIWIIEDEPESFAVTSVVNDE
jgi:ABC-type Fe3+/spermidine/putrescine transport system ATPase subunit